MNETAASAVQLVFTIPKLLRKAFLFDRALYGDLSRVAYAATRDFFKEQFPSLDDPVPATIVSPQSFGDLLNPHPHLHAVSSLDVFDRREGRFHAAPPDLDFSPLEELFRERTLNMMLRREKITPERVAMLRSWRHSGFNLDSSRRVEAGDRKALESLLEYIEPSGRRADALRLRASPRSPPASRVPWPPSRWCSTGGRFRGRARPSTCQFRSA